MARTLAPESTSSTPAAPDAGSGGMMHSMRRYPAFRQVMMGTLATNTAFWMYQVAVGWLALELTDSAFFVGLAGFVSGIPLLILSLPAGVINDRYDRKFVLLAAQAWVMVFAAIFALMITTDTIAKWSMLVLAGAYGAGMSFIFPTRTAIVPSLVDREDLPNAIALNSAAQNAPRVVGPAAAGIMIAIFGTAGTFALAAAFQIFALISTWKLPNAIAAGGGVRGNVWTSLMDGMRVVARTPILTALMMLALAPTILVMPYLNMMPVFAVDELGLGSRGLGLLLAATGAGTVVGALAVARSPRIRNAPGAQVKTAAIFAGLIAIFAWMPSVWAALPVLFVGGCVSAAYLALNQTALQMNVSDDTRGRVLGIYLMTWGMLPFGQIAVGAAAARIGAPAAVSISALLALLAIALITHRFPALRT